MANPTLSSLGFRLLILVWAATWFLTALMHSIGYYPDYDAVDRRLRREGALARGIVMQRELTGDRRARDCQIAVLFNTYRSTGIPENQTMTATGDRCQFEVGEQVAVHYLPTDPQLALILGFNYEVTWRDRAFSALALSIGTASTHFAIFAKLEPADPEA